MKLFFRKLILSSDAWPGPVELIRDLENGFVFENENLNNFLKNLKILIIMKNDSLITLNGQKFKKI